MYKNWVAICQITDTHFMWALALLDLATEFGRMVAGRFPEYFSNEQQAGPYPLSVIRKLANKSANDEGVSHTNCLVSHDHYWRREFEIPIIEFSTIEDKEHIFNDAEMLPTELSAQIQAHEGRVNVGDVFVWEGKKIVLLEDNDSCCFMDFAPAELIAVDR